MTDNKDFYIVMFMTRYDAFNGLSIFDAPSSEKVEEYVKENLLNDGDGEHYYMWKMPQDEIIKIDKVNPVLVLTPK